MKIKGILLIGTKDFIVNRYGEEKWQELLNNLPERSRLPLKRMILPGGLYDISVYTDLNLLADKLLGKGDGSILEEIGATTAEDSLNLYESVFKNKLTSPEDALKNMVPLLAKMLFEEMESDTIKVENSYGEYVLRGKILEDKDFAFLLARRTIGWIKEVFKKIGVITEKVDYEIGEDGKGKFLRLRIWWK